MMRTFPQKNLNIFKNQKSNIFKTKHEKLYIMTSDYLVGFLT